MFVWEEGCCFCHWLIFAGRGANRRRFLIVWRSNPETNKKTTSVACITMESGVVFPIQVHKSLPVDSLFVSSISIRGNLGDISVYVRMDGELDPSTSLGWERIYSGKHKASFEKLVPIHFPSPLELKPSQRICMYVHSTLPGDTAIVYDNWCGQGPIWTDDFISVMDGLAHVSNRPFGNTSIWGWGSAWRRDRAFVGRISYGVRWSLWRPQTHLTYGSSFRKSVNALYMLQRRDECILSRMPDEIIMYTLNFCRWDWFSDSVQVLYWNAAGSAAWSCVGLCLHDLAKISNIRCKL